MESGFLREKKNQIKKPPTISKSQRNCHFHMFCHFQLPRFSSPISSKAQNPSAALTSLLVERSIADHCRSQMLGTKEVSRSIQ
jgi:hypothetical protein